jgi:hypothetical protein
VATGVEGTGEGSGRGHDDGDGDGRRGDSRDGAPAPAPSYAVMDDAGRVRAGGDVQVVVGEEVAEDAL